MKKFINDKINNPQIMLCVGIAFFLPISMLLVNILVGMLLLINAHRYYSKAKDNNGSIKDILWIWMLTLPFIIIAFIYSLDMANTYSGRELSLNLEQKASYLIFPLILLFDPNFVKNRSKIILSAFVVGCFSVVIVSQFYAGYLSLFGQVDIGSSSNWDNISRHAAVGKLAILDPFFYKEFLVLFEISPVYFSSYLWLSTYILWYYYFAKIKTWGNYSKICFFILSILQVAALIQLSVRGILIPFLLFSVSVILFYIYKRYKLIYATTAAIIISLILFVLVTSFPILKSRLVDQVKTTMTNYTNGKPNSIKIRAIQLHCGWELFKNAPVFGHGQKKSEKLLWECSMEKLPKEYKSKLNAHNQFIQFLIEIGMFGLLLFILPFLMPFIFYRKKKSLYTIFVIIMLVAFLTESIMDRFNGYMFVFFFYTVLLSRLIYNNDKNIYNNSSL